MPDYTNVTNIIGSHDHKNLQEDSEIKRHAYEIVEDDNIPISSAPPMPLSEMHKNKVEKKFPNIFPRNTSSSIRKETESNEDNRDDMVFGPNDENKEDNGGLGRVTLI